MNHVLPSSTARLQAPNNWQGWLTTLFPRYVGDFAPHHREMWQWAWNIRRGESPRPFVAVWPRGGGKSTSAELASVLVGARKQRKYVLYVRSTQEQADTTISNISAMLESPTVEAYYPELGQRMVGKYGNSKGWRRNRLRTSAGLTIDGIGLDTAARGARVDEDRPDLIIFDDIDEKHDSPQETKKKIEIITTSLLPAGSADAAVLCIQNLIIPNGVFSQLVDGRADFLHNRIVSGPHPAIEGLTYEQRPEGGFVVTGGSPVWNGQDISVCQRQINDWGLSAFLQEAQHEVDAPPGGMFDHLVYCHCKHDEVPTLRRVVVWLDPAVTKTDQSDSAAVQVDGIDDMGTIYRLWSWEKRATPQEAMSMALQKAIEYKAMSVGVETDQGGDTWLSVYREACHELRERGVMGMRTIKDFPAFRSAKAGEGHGPKVHRASLMLSDYEKGRFVHVEGTHNTLERALNRFPLTKPYDLTDVCYWCWHDLRYGSTKRRATSKEY